MVSFDVLIGGVRRWVNEHPALAFASAGLLMGSAFIHPVFVWAGVVGLAFFFGLIPLLVTQKEAFWYGTLTGTTKTLLAASWVWYVYPLTWMGDFSPVSQLFGIGWMWVTGSVAVGVSLGIFAFLTYRYHAHLLRFLIIPPLYVGAELIGSLFFSIMQYGPGGTMNFHTSFGYLGYTLAAHDVLGLLARVVGVYGLSFVVAALALFLVTTFIPSIREGIFRSYRHAVIAFIPIFIILTYFLSFSPAPAGAGVRVATVNTQFENGFDMTVDERAERVRLLIDAFRAALRSESDIILFPETSYALSVFGSPENVFAFSGKETENDVLIIDSDDRPNEDGTTAVRAVLYDTSGEAVYATHKKFLVPSGEYVPYQLSFMMSLLGFRETTDALGETLEFVPGDESLYDTDRALPGVLFCSESVSPIRAFRVAREATLPLIVHPVSHAWLNEPTTFWYQLDLMLRTQARFARLPIVQASNMASPEAYDRYGTPLHGDTIFETASTSVVVYEV
jgi:apolipoprotein N-acyltransferase